VSVLLTHLFFLLFNRAIIRRDDSPSAMLAISSEILLQEAVTTARAGFLQTDSLSIAVL